MALCPSAKRFRNKDGSVREYLYIVKGVPVEASFREELWELGRVKAVQLEVRGKPYLARTELSGHAY